MANTMSYATGPGLATRAVAVTPHDTNDLTDPAFALYVGAGGTVKVQPAGGDPVTFVGVPTGTVLPIRGIRRVYSTGTSASSILALY